MMKYIVIVDGYRASEQYFGAYKKEGVQCIHVKSKDYKKDGLFADLNPENYAAEISMGNNLNGIIEQLTPYNQGDNEIIGAMGGIDGGTELADQISYALNLRTSNGIKKSQARRDKYEMVEELKRTDSTIKTVSHLKSNNLADIYEFINGLSKQYPVVLKPINSGGTDNVFICRNENEVKAAYDRIMKSDNVFEQHNSEVLVQSYLSGREFMVNGVSCNGQYVCTDIWEYSKKTNENGRPLYEYEDALPIEGDEQNLLREYVQKVLTALGVQYGVTHVEVMLTEENGPVLVEMATRVCGCKKVALYDAVYGINPYEMTVLSYLDEAKFQQKAAERNTLSLIKHARHADLASNQEGVIERETLSQFVDENSPSRLPSVFSAALPKVGEKLEKTKDLLSTLGTVIFVHEDPEQIQTDYKVIKDVLPRAFQVRNTHSLGRSWSREVLDKAALPKEAAANADEKAEFLPIGGVCVC